VLSGGLAELLGGAAGSAFSLGLKQLCQPLLLAAIELGGLDPPAMPVIAVPKEQPVGFVQIALLSGATPWPTAGVFPPMPPLSRPL
jgi:hypothetical protein